MVLPTFSSFAGSPVMSLGLPMCTSMFFSASLPLEVFRGSMPLIVLLTILSDILE